MYLLFKNHLCIAYRKACLEQYLDLKELNFE